MSKNVNVVIASPKSGMNGRAYSLPDDLKVKAGQKLAVETDDGVQQIVTCLSPNIEVREEDMHSFLDKWGCEGDKVLPAIALVVEEPGDEDDALDAVHSALEELKKKLSKVADDEDEYEEPEEKKSVEDMLQLIESGIESLSTLVKSIRKENPLDCDAVKDALMDVNESLFAANLKAFALDVAVTVGGNLLNIDEEDEE